MTDPQILIDYEAHGLALATRSGILDDLREALECDEISAAIVEPLADDEPTRAHLAALRARAERIRTAISAIEAEMDRRAIAHYRAERDRLLEIATRPGQGPAVTSLLRPLIADAESAIARIEEGW